MTPLEQSKEIIRKHCEKQPKPCYLMRDLEDPFNEIETALKDYELLKERTKLDSFECLLRLEEILPRGKELLIPVAKQLKALEIIEKTWGSRILNDIQDGFVLGSPFTVLPPKEDCEFLKEILCK